MDVLRPDASRNPDQMLSTPPNRGRIGVSSTLGRQLSHVPNIANMGSDVPNMTGRGSQGLNRDTTIGVSRSRALPKLIQKALQTCKDNGNARSFLPEDKLAEIMTTENVRNYLLISAKSSLREHHITITEHVCGQPGRSNSRRESRRVFAILLLIQEPCLILDFIDQGIDDSDLPLSMIRDNSSSFGSESTVDDDEDDYLARSTSSGPIIIKGFCRWQFAQRETFYNNQWRVQIPIFRKLRRQTPELHPIHTFDNDIILPWTEYEEHYDGNSVVSRVKVHKAHSQLVSGVSEFCCFEKPIHGSHKYSGRPITCFEISQAYRASRWGTRVPTRSQSAFKGEGKTSS